MLDYYQILNVNHGASPLEVKASFRKLAIIHHPDKNNGSKKSEEYFKLLLQAYETLIDPQKREGYDSKFQGFKKQKVNNSNPWREQTVSKETFKQPNSKSKGPNSYNQPKIKSNDLWFFVWFVCLIFLVMSIVVNSFMREGEIKKSEIIRFSDITENTKQTIKKSENKSKPILDEQEKPDPESGEIDF